MPRYLDTHVHSLDVESHLHRGPKSADGILVLEIIHVEEWRYYCLLDAPDIESVERFHLRDGITCDWIGEVTSVDEVNVDSSAEIAPPHHS